MGQAKLKKILGLQNTKILIGASGEDNKIQEEIEFNKQLDTYLASRLSQPGYFSRTGWQAWLFLAIQHPKDFPVSLKQYLDIAASRLMLPVCHSSLDGLLHSYYQVHGVRMIPCFLDQYDKSREELRDQKWKRLTSSMNFQLNRLLLNSTGLAIASVKEQQNANSPPGKVQLL